MNLQTILYFSSILLTCALTGFLSWYAWRQPALPGVRTFAWMTLSECLLALTEILSMLGGTQEQALFWFNVRVIFIAIIPVLWLKFALEYNGRKDWFSKRLLAGIFIIPMVTQVVLWSNSLHGLWVKQEVAFHQNGPFWIVETSARIPGIWFMVHSFYSLILLLTGTGVILFTAWGKQRQFRGQAILLTIGALVSLGTTVIPIFNIFPQAEFNPFTPGVGIAALFYALAIFRFQFLKRTPTQESTSQITRLDAHEKRSLAVFIFIFILFTSAIATASYITYQNYEKQFRTQVESQLSAIADLKVSGLENWRTERMADAESIYDNPAFTALVQRTFENPEDIQAKDQLQAWLDTIRSSYRYERVLLLDTTNIERVSSPTTPKPIVTHLTQEAAAIIRSGKVTFLDIHRDLPGNTLHLSLLVPIYAEQDLNRPLGLLVLLIDPHEYLYPYIQQWPVPSQSAETLLVRRDGEDVLYLNELKFEENAALNLRVPLKETQVLAVQTTLGQTGIVHGLDYRGKEVMGDVRAVPDSPWFLVSKIDTAEVYAPLNERLWQTIFFFGALILAASVGLVLFWRQQRLNYYRVQYESAESLRKSQEQYRELIEHASDGIFIADSNGKYLDVNPSGCAMLGYTRDEILSKRISELVAPEDIAATPLRLEELRQGKTVLSERRLICKDGRLLPVEISGRMLPDGRFQSIIRDITERKQAEEAQKQSEHLFRALFELSPDAVVLLDPHDPNVSSPIVDCNAAACLMSGYDRNELIGQPIDIVNADPYTQGGQITYLKELRDAGNLKYEVFHRRKNGVVFPVEVSTAIIKVGERELVIGIDRDITERKRAEQALKESEERWRRAIADSPIPVMIHDEDDRVLQLSAGWTKFSGYDIDDIPTLADWTERAYGERSGFKKDYIDQLFSINQTVQNGEWIVTAKDGSKRIWDFQTTPLGKGSQGRRILHSMAIDITERKRAEKALRESEEKYRSLVQSIQVGVVVHAPDSSILFSNSRASELLGLTPDQMRGKTAIDPAWHFIREDGAQVPLEEYPVNRALATNVPISNMILGILRPDWGGPTWVQCNAHQDRDLSGNLQQVVISFADITERKREEEALQGYNTRLETEVEQRTRELREAQEQLVRQERLATLGQLAGSIGHELRNPLGVISNAVYFLKLSQPNASDKVKEYLDIIEKETRTSDKIVTDLLDFTRIKSLDRQSASVSKLIHQALERNPAPESVETKLEIAADLPQIYVDPQHVIQVFGNLISNAFQSMVPESGVSTGSTTSMTHDRKLTVSAVVESAMIKVDIQDMGMGIPPENMKKLFEPLFTTKIKGIGLGLAVSRKLTEANGGRIEAKSETGKGSTFTVYLPVYKESK